MQENITKEKTMVIIVIAALFLTFSFLAGVAYSLLLRPSFGDSYANLFFMISFTIIFFSLVYLYHIWIVKIQKRGD